MLLQESHKRTGGFTFVEIVIIAPIVILMIGAFIGVVVSMTGQVLESRAENILVYNVQDALNRIESDVKLSTTFLAQNSVIVNSPSTPGDLQPGQGSDDGTASFTNVDGSGNASLILNELATTGSPLDSGSQVAYLSNQPNACGSLQGQNTPLSYNVVYYIKTVNGVSSLWRRVIMPGNYATSACNAIGSSSPGIAVPWQQPSCTPGYNATTDPICATNDVDLVDGVAPGSFNIDYYQTSSSTAADSGAVTGSDPKARGNALVADTTINASIDAIQQVAGRSVEQAASMRVTRLDTNASTIAAAVASTTPSAPSGVAASRPVSTQGSVTWYPTYGATTYTLQYDTNSNFTSPTVVSGINTASKLLTGLDPNTVYYIKVRAINGQGVSPWSSFAVLQVAPPTDAPANLVVYARTTNTNAKASWNAVTGAIGYRIQTAITSAFDSRVDTITVTGTSIATFTGALIPGQPAYFRVQGINLGGAGPWSSTISPVTMLSSGQCIDAAVNDTALRSPNGAYTLSMQSDGNLVVYNASQIAQWNTGTSGSGTGSRLCMQGDGNLVVYNASNVAVWNIGKSGSGSNNHAIIQSDGNFVVYTATNGVVWSRE